MPFRFVPIINTGRLLSFGTLLMTCACGDGVSGLLLGSLPEMEVPNNEAEPPPGVIAPSAQDRPRASAGAPAVDEPEPIDWQIAQCSPDVEFENLDSSDAGLSVEAFIEDPTLLIQTAAQSACLALYRQADVVPLVETIHFTLEDFEGVGTMGGENLRLSTRYLSNFHNQNGDGKNEALGISIYLLAHIYQQILPETPYWLISGKADAARLHAGYLDINGRSQGGTWTDGSRTTAYFFAWIEQDHPDFVHDLNERMQPDNGTYSDELFVELTGTSLVTLWDNYQASF